MKLGNRSSNSQSLAALTFRHMRRLMTGAYLQPSHQFAFSGTAHDPPPVAYASLPIARYSKWLNN
ncbi:hypothetical protein [Rhodopirellula sp. SWK7]|uniref:hypothetical protein n=1 Tax=Rhodopirellula sp. SWK7 TaxID=595460 RepID=UPI0002BF59C3|nr:hypothetical protein [Rhodopirellula sp. SWK7]EMI43455.1 hypothetical protein RRSWK_03976 [Rhodopirellula sp. SWK7]